MANYVYNLLKCNNELTYETIKSHITNNGQSIKNLLSHHILSTQNACN